MDFQFDVVVIVQFFQLKTISEMSVTQRIGICFNIKMYLYGNKTSALGKTDESTISQIKLFYKVRIITPKSNKFF